MRLHVVSTWFKFRLLHIQNIHLCAKETGTGSGLYLLTKMVKWSKWDRYRFSKYPFVFDFSPSPFFPQVNYRRGARKVTIQAQSKSIFSAGSTYSRSGLEEGNIWRIRTHLTENQERHYEIREGFARAYSHTLLSIREGDMCGFSWHIHLPSREWTYFLQRRNYWCQLDIDIEQRKPLSLLPLWDWLSLEH